MQHFERHVTERRVHQVAPHESVQELARFTAKPCGRAPKPQTRSESQQTSERRAHGRTVSDFRVGAAPDVVELVEEEGFRLERGQEHTYRKQRNTKLKKGLNAHMLSSSQAAIEFGNNFGVPKAYTCTVL